MGATRRKLLVNDSILRSKNFFSDIAGMPLLHLAQKLGFSGAMRPSRLDIQQRKLCGLFVLSLLLVLIFRTLVVGTIYFAAKNQHKLVLNQLSSIVGCLRSIDVTNIDEKPYVPYRY